MPTPVKYNILFEERAAVIASIREGLTDKPITIELVYSGSKQSEKITWEKGKVVEYSLIHPVIEEQKTKPPRGTVSMMAKEELA